MNFVRYDPSTGEILSIGWSSPESVQAEIDAGLPTLSFSEPIQWGQYRINLSTKQLEPISESINP